MAESPRRTFGYYWELCEAILGLLAVFIIGFAPVTLGVLFGLAALVNAENRDIPWWLGLPALLLGWVMAVWLARMTARALYTCHPELREWDQYQMQLRRGPAWTPFLPRGSLEQTSHPMAVYLGLKLPRVPWYAAPFLSLWWLLHFAAGVALCLAADRWIEHSQPRVSAEFRLLLTQALGFPLTFAVNVYLLLAVAVFARRESVLGTVWRWRVLIDVAVTLVPLLAVWLARR